MLLSIVFRNINLHSQLLWSYQQTEQYFSGLRRENTEGVYGCGNRMIFFFFFLAFYRLSYWCIPMSYIFKNLLAHDKAR